MAHIINVLCEASFKAMALHKQEKFAEINDEKATENLKAILRDELQGFIANDLKEAYQSGLGEGWLKLVINAQCNFWAVKALKAAKGN